MVWFTCYLSKDRKIKWEKVEKACHAKGVVERLRGEGISKVGWKVHGNEDKNYGGIGNDPVIVPTGSFPMPLFVERKRARGDGLWK